MNYYKRVIVFDVETNGLFPKVKKGATPEETKQEPLPYILQLSFIVYDPKNKQVLRTANHYVKVEDSVPISDEITTLTGIDRAIVNEKGVHITHALNDFYKEYMNCDCVVAHNINFDRAMMKLEIGRNMKMLENMGCISAKQVFQKEFQERHRIDNFCTMNYSKPICKIERVGKNGVKYYKAPRLVELYEHLFHSIPENLHDSMVDTYACLMCFAKIKLRQDLPNTFLRVSAATSSMAV